MNILILDDDPTIVELIHTAIVARFRNQITIGAFTNTADAYEYASGKTIDLAFLDMKMPSEDGYEFMRRLNGHLKSVRFITGMGSSVKKALTQPETKDKKIKIYEKPFKTSAILKDVENALTNWMLLDMIASLEHTRAYCAR